MHIQSFNRESEEVSVTWELDGSRFDMTAQRLSKNWFSDPIPRSIIQRAIECGDITLQNEVRKPMDRVSKSDKIVFTKNFFKSIRKREERTFPEGEQPVLISENESFLVIYKPASWLTHQVANYQEEASLEDWMLQKRLISEDIPNNGRVHRLDRNTSGLIIYAKNKVVQESLKILFQERKISKTYVALVTGHFTELKGSIVAPIIRKKASFKRMVAPDAYAAEAKSAETQYRVIARSNEYDLIFAEPKTGRTHQIRVHMEHLGYPIVGDSLYGGSKSLLNRQFLHALELSFNFRSQNFHFFASLPLDLQKVIITLDAEPLKRYDDEALKTIGLKQRKGFFSLFTSKGSTF